MTTTLSVGVGPNDRTLPLMAGLVDTDGLNFDFSTAPLEELFARAFDEAAYDVAELSFSNFLYLTSTGECPYVGLPIFPSRSFRHSALYIRTDRGIVTPADLAGRKVGVREYSMTAALVARGILEDEYSVRSQNIHWRYGPADDTDLMPIARMTPQGVDINPIQPGTNLSEMLIAGEIDAMLAYKPPKIALGEQSHVDRMFPDYKKVEAEYARRTGIFPIMHLVGLKRELAESDSSLVLRVCDAFEKSRQFSCQRIGENQAPFTVLPWGALEAERTRALLGADYWTYGTKDNQHALEALCRYSYAQGITTDRLSVSELFHPDALDWIP